MMGWLVDTREMFGLAGQNWMLVVAGAVVAYVVVLLLLSWRPRI